MERCTDAALAVLRTVPDEMRGSVVSAAGGLVEPAVVVTALIELEPGVAGSSRRSVAEYLRLGDAVLSLDMPLVVFCDEGLVEQVAARRAELAPTARTVVLPFEWHPEAEGDVAFLRSALERDRSASTSNEAKDTAEYLALGWSKPFQLQRAAALVPAKQYWWIDFGLAHVAEVPARLNSSLCVDSTALGHPPLHFVTLHEGDWHRQPQNWERVVLGAASGRPDWWRLGAQLVCGGVFGVAAASVDEFVDWYRQVLAEPTGFGAPVTDEMVFSRLVLRHRASVRLTHAAYPTLLRRLQDALVPSVSDLCPSARFVDLPGPERPDRASLNPSIANDPVGGYGVVVRHANYRYENGRYIQLDGSSDIITDNVLVRLDDEFRVVSVRPINDHLARTYPPQFPVHGLEDMRLFRYRDAWWVSATLREHRQDGLCEIVVAELDDAATITSAYLVPSPVAGRHEKNWAPIEGMARMEFLWNTEPPVPIGLDRDLGVTTLSRALPHASGCSPARGSSQVIRVDGGWLTVVHHAHSLTDRQGERREYRHRFVQYDDRWQICASSPEFSFQFAGIEFCAGLARTGDGVVMSFGVEDRLARLVTISWSDLRAMLDAGRESVGRVPV